MSKIGENRSEHSADYWFVVNKTRLRGSANYSLNPLCAAASGYTTIWTSTSSLEAVLHNADTTSEV